jgi:hypothetical protein
MKVRWLIGFLVCSAVAAMIACGSDDEVLRVP